MAYSGSQLPIALGQLGLLTDDTASALPVNSLAKANNIDFKAGRLSKSKGSNAFNDTSLGTIVSVFDYWPDADNQRLIAITAEGDIFRDTGSGNFNTYTPINTLSAFTQDTKMLTGGNEVAGANKKLFILSEANQVQIIDGDGSTTRAVNYPAVDWETSNYPTYGVQYQNKMVMMGSAADPHRLYFSTLSDHENFVGTLFPNSRVELWSRVAATPNVDLTSSIHAGTAVTLFTNIDNNGYIVYGISKFNKFTFVISQAATGGAPVYSYEYWNGSAWTALTLTTTPDYSVTGTTSAEFVAPASWVVGDGTEGGGNNAYYAIRVLATTHPNTDGKATSLKVYNTNFDALPDTVSVYPGEGDKIMCAQEYRGLLFIFKKPYGVYILDGRNPDSAQWTLSKYSDAFGVASPHGVLQILGDLVAANSIGSFTSLKASNAFGDFEAGDILANNKVEDYIRGELSFDGISLSQSIYYPEKKIAMWTGKTESGTNQNRILAIDVAAPNPRISIINKDQPNALALRKDSQGISRPMYGSASGFVYLMDSNTYNVGGTSFLGEFQTNYSDLGQVDSQLAGKNKIFDFLEVKYIPTGNNSFSVDIFIDGELRATKTFDMFLGTELDSFILDSDALAGDAGTRRNRLPLKSCTGNKISLRFYNSGNNEGFTVESVILNFRLSAEQVYTSQIV